MLKSDVTIPHIRCTGYWIDMLDYRVHFMKRTRHEEAYLHVRRCGGGGAGLRRDISAGRRVNSKSVLFVERKLSLGKIIHIPVHIHI